MLPKRQDLQPADKSPQPGTWFDFMGIRKNNAIVFEGNDSNSS